MTVFLLDKFTLEGALNGSLPEIGRPSTTWSASSGIKSGGYLVAPNNASFNWFGGEIRLPSPGAAYSHLTVRCKWLFSTESPVRAYAGFAEGWYKTVFEYNTSSGVPACTGILGPIDAASINPDGVNEVVVSLNFQDKTAITYINGVLVQTGVMAFGGGEGSAYPRASLLFFEVGGTTERFNGTLLRSQLDELEVTDEPYVPLVEPFWTNVVGAVETP
jgi:hypothetical protein